MSPKTLRRALREIVESSSANTAVWDKCRTSTYDNIDAAVPDGKIRLEVRFTILPSRFGLRNSRLTSIYLVDQELEKLLVNEP